MRYKYQQLIGYIILSSDGKYSCRVKALFPHPNDGEGGHELEFNTVSQQYVARADDDTYKSSSLRPW